MRICHIYEDKFNEPLQDRLATEGKRLLGPITGMVCIQMSNIYEVVVYTNSCILTDVPWFTHIHIYTIYLTIIHY